MNFTFLSGLATGVGIGLFLQSQRGKQLKKNIGESVARGLLQGEDALYSTIKTSEDIRIKLIDQTH